MEHYKANLGHGTTVYAWRCPGANWFGVRFLDSYPTTFGLTWSEVQAEPIRPHESALTLPELLNLGWYVQGDPVRVS